MTKTYRRSSDMLLAIANQSDLNREVTYQRILQILGERAFGIILLFFALPSALPFSVIPGISVFFSLPIAILASQMVFARKTLWLPKMLAERTIHYETMTKMIHAAVPYLIKIEYFLKPRWAFMTYRFMEIVNGIIIFCIALLLMLPIPLSNFILATLLIIFSLGLIEKDGLFIVLGYIAAIFYVSFIYLFIMTAIKRLFS
ncbi:exopolysaccharide biosynthesis protein [Legionella oakridgensis]|uniref:ABC-type transport system, permease component n=2 Tax=Legionella oakridgensis TaxID=29423 RepID=W0BD20_9GAMM|nr:exopolysaccharide biosynthesis protein [Legionella oakridgensis]AHE66289.1 ABC-type transport system, permease component [Legionella oakridgensis ATCC 33761 = DSM 21215]ETO93927.1 ABC-type transport system, permease component [Legionella oakridgensis RV-2-2007]KTD37230.1 proton transporter [Legionella oakridgensis]STY16182.1 ABC transporter permease [Legionella longbeachae]